jgi:hypothetical protein
VGPGIADKFDFHIEFTPDGAEPSDDPDASPSIFSVLGLRGLKLAPAKGPRVEPSRGRLRIFIMIPLLPVHIVAGGLAIVFDGVW